MNHIRDKITHKNNNNGNIGAYMNNSLWTQTEYVPKLCTDVIEMFAEGKSRSEFCAKHNIAQETFDAWRRRFPLFDAACKVAHEKARAYYDEMRRKYIVEHHESSRLNTALFNRMYNVRFKVPEKRTVKVKGFDKAKSERELLSALTKAVAAGELTTDEAQKLASLIDSSLKIKQTEELEKRLAAIEEAHETRI